MKVDQFVPICSIEVNSSPVSPGYWPSQQEPPANPYTESEWEREREEGGWSGNERERQAISEKNGHLQRRRPEMQWRRDSEEEAEEGARSEMGGRESGWVKRKKGEWQRGTGARRSFLCSTKLELKEWTRSKRHASEAASNLALKQKQWYMGKF